MKKILIVDDEPSITEIIQMYATRLGYTSDSANSGDEALEKLRQNEYWAVFCDLLMPGLGGLDIYERVSEMSDCGPERFVLLTGTVLDDHTQTRLTNKNIIVFHKPFNFESISKTFHLLEKEHAA